jgi:putative acetyltransferase
MELLIRRVLPSDAERIHDLHLASVRGLCGSFYEPGVIEEWLRGRSPAGYSWGISKGATFVAQFGDAIIGICEAIPGEILAVFVDPPWAGRGVGKALLLNAWDRAAGEAGRVRLESTLNATRFYEHVGFCQVGLSTVRRNDVDVPVVLMEKLAG